jgi:hypothetical protein
MFPDDNKSCLSGRRRALLLLRLPGKIIHRFRMEEDMLRSKPQMMHDAGHGNHRVGGVGYHAWEVRIKKSMECLCLLCVLL